MDKKKLELNKEKQLEIIKDEEKRASNKDYQKNCSHNYYYVSSFFFFLLYVTKNWNS